MIILRILLIFGIFAVSLGGYSTTYHHGYSGNLYSPIHSTSTYSYSYPQTFYSTKPKHKAPIKAALPISQVYEVELLKPHTQMKEQSKIPLYIIPQDSLHIFPHKQLSFGQPGKLVASPAIKPLGVKGQYGHGQVPFVLDPGHIAAIELPLIEPMVIGSVHTQVVAPAGFSIVQQGPYGLPLDIPYYTGALLAPVPAGTIVSAEIPVVLNTIYAVQSLPSVPSFYPVFANLQQVPASSSPSAGPLVSYPQLTPQPQLQPQASPQVQVQEQTENIQHPGQGYPAPAQNANIFAQNPNNFGQNPNNFGQNPSQIVSITTTRVPPESPPPTQIPPQQITLKPQRLQQQQQQQQQRPFQNSKESIYLQELREDSIRRQIAELQQLLDSYKAQRP